MAAEIDVFPKNSILKYHIESNNIWSNLYSIAVENVALQMKLVDLK